MDSTLSDRTVELFSLAAWVTAGSKSKLAVKYRGTGGEHSVIHATVMARIGVATKLAPASPPAAWAAMDDAMWWLQLSLLKKTLAPFDASVDIGGVCSAMTALRSALRSALQGACMQPSSSFPSDLANVDLVYLRDTIDAAMRPQRVTRTFRADIANSMMHVLDDALWSAAPHALYPYIGRELSTLVRTAIMSDDALKAMRASLDRGNDLNIRHPSTWATLVRLGVAHFVMPSAHRHGLFREEEPVFELDDDRRPTVAGALAAASLSVFVVSHPDQVPAVDVYPWIQDRLQERARALHRRCAENPAFVSRMFKRLEAVPAAADEILLAGVVRQRFAECPICMEEDVALLPLDCCGGGAGAVLAGGPVHVMCAQCWHDLPSNRCPTCDRVCSQAPA